MAMHGKCVGGTSEDGVFPYISCLNFSACLSASGHYVILLLTNQVTNIEAHEPTLLRRYMKWISFGIDVNQVARK